MGYSAPPPPKPSASRSTAARDDFAESMVRFQTALQGLRAQSRALPSRPDPALWSTSHVEHLRRALRGRSGWRSWLPGARRRAHAACLDLILYLERALDLDAYWTERAAAEAATSGTQPSAPVELLDGVGRVIPLAPGGAVHFLPRDPSNRSTS